MYDFTILPHLGRRVARTEFNVLTSNAFLISKPVDNSAVFTSGQLAKLASDSNGVPIVANITSTADTPIGVFAENNSESIWKPVINELHVFGENITASLVINLNNTNIKANSCAVRKSSDNTLYIQDADYTIDLNSGLITTLNIEYGQYLDISYTYLAAYSLNAGVVVSGGDTFSLAAFTIRIPIPA